MKQIIIFSLLLLFFNVSIAQREIGNGWFLRNQTITDASTLPYSNMKESDSLPDISEIDSASLNFPVPTDLDDFDEEILSLARNLDNDVLKILEYVKRNIKTEIYYGIKKGAVMTLHDGSGNDYDKVNLFIELCKAAGVPSESLYFCKVADVVPIFRNNNNIYSLESLTGLNIDTQFGNISTLLKKLDNINHILLTTGSNEVVAIGLVRIKVAFILNGGLYISDLLQNDATFVRNTVCDINLPDLKSIAGGNISGSQVSNINESALYKELNVQSSKLRANMPTDASINNYVGKLEYSGEILNPFGYLSLNSFYRFSSPAAFYDYISTFKDSSYVYHQDDGANGPLLSPTFDTNKPVFRILYRTPLPQDYSSLKIEVKDKNNTLLSQNNSLKISDLNSRRLWLNFSGNTAKFQFETETPFLTANVADTEFLVKFSITKPRDKYSSDYSLNSDTIYFKENTYKKNNNYVYNIAYSFSASDTLLAKRRSKFSKMLKDAKASNILDNSGAFVFANPNSNEFSQAQKELVAECLNVMGLEWMLQTQKASTLVLGTMACDFGYEYRLGRIAQEGGYYIDIGLQTSHSYDVDGGVSKDCFDINAILLSAFEHSVIQQIQKDFDAISSVNIFHYANTRSSSIPLVLLDNPNFNASLLTGYSAGEIQILRDSLTVESGNAEILIPQNRQATPSGTVNGTTWDWSGYGYILITDTSVSMMISGDMQGGYATTNKIFNPKSMSDFYPSSSIQNCNITAPTIRYNANISSIIRIGTFGADPVDLQSGAYLYNSDDLNVGDLNFQRHYNSNLSDINKSNLGYGWTHNYDINLSTRSASEVALGDGTPAQMADFITGIYALKSVYCNKSVNETAGQKAHRFAVSSFVAKWAVDSILDNVVVLVMGKDSLQFVKTKDAVTTGSDVQLNDVYLSPVGTNLHMEKNGTSYVIEDSYGDTMRFNSENKISEIEDVLGRKTTFTYNNTTKNLISIKDFYNKQLNFTYSTEGNILKVSDSENATNYTEFEYINSDLSLAKTSLGNSGSYIYNNHKMTELKNGLNQTVVKNIYEDNGSVRAQLSCGDESKEWKMFYTGKESKEVNPQGRVVGYAYDDNGLCTIIVDQAGNSTTFKYDAQMRIIKKILPNGDEIRMAYDKWNNKLSEDVYSKSLGDEGSLVWESGTIYVYESETVANGDVPRLLSTIQRDAENSNTGRLKTINSYYSINGKKTELPLSTTDEKGVVTTYTYDTQGNMLSETIGGRTTSYQYANSVFKDKPTSITYPDATVETLSYNVNGDVATRTKNGLTTTYTYDNKRRLIATSSIGNGISSPITTSTTYDLANNILSETNEDKITKSYTWTAQQKMLTSTVGTGTDTQTTTYTYDVSDRLIKTTMPDGKSINLTLDLLGRTVFQRMGNRITSFAYDKLGRVIRTTSPSGIITQQTYNAAGNKISETDGRGNTITTTYNPFGEITNIKNRRGGNFSSALDIANRTNTQTTPTGKTTVTNFVPNTWDISSVTYPSGNTTTYTYDSAGRVSSSSYYDTTVSFGYNSTNGKLSQISENNSHVNYDYDALGRVTSSTADGLTVSYSYSFEGASKVETITYPAIDGISAKTIIKKYDTFGRLYYLSDWANRITTYEYDTGNRLTKVNRPNGTYRELIYDSTTGDLKQISERKLNGTPFAISSYTYDSEGRISKIICGPAPEKIARNAFTADYDLDNRLASFNNNTVIYDDNGNMIVGPLNEIETNSVFTYDSRNRLTSAGDLAYTYDAEGNRKTITERLFNKLYETTFVYDRSGDVNNVLIRIKKESEIVQDSEGNQTYTLLSTKYTYYVHGVGLSHEVEITSDAETPKYYHYDQVGSTIALTDANGNPTDRFSYDIWGYSIQTLGTSDTPFRYVGLFGIQTDSNGLVNMRARYYNPTTMSFITADPSGFKGGLNWYLYANGNALAYIDKDGEMPALVTAALVGGIIGAALEGGAEYLNQWQETDRFSKSDIEYAPILLAAAKGFVTGASTAALTPISGSVAMAGGFKASSSLAKIFSWGMTSGISGAAQLTSNYISARYLRKDYHIGRGVYTAMIYGPVGQGMSSLIKTTGFKTVAQLTRFKAAPKKITKYLTGRNGRAISASFGLSSGISIAPTLK